MTGLKYTMGAMEAGTTRRTYGTAYYDGSRWWARIGDSLLDARWLDPIQPLQGGRVVIDITNDGLGQSSALVIGGYTDQPRPSTGTVADILPPGPGVQLVVTGDDGVTYTTGRFIGSYNIGDPVYLTWDAATPTVIGKIGAISVPPPVAPPVAAPGAGTGQAKRITVASDTWGVGGWGRWATSQAGGEDVYSGALGGYTLTGAWFYGAADPALAGKTVTGVRFYLPARLPGVGSYNAAATIHVYAHDSTGRPGGDVNRVAGPFDVNVIAGFRGGFIDLPLTFASALVNGGGISIAGGPYIGFESRLDNPESGKLLLDWTA